MLDSACYYFRRDTQLSADLLGGAEACGRGEERLLSFETAYDSTEMSHLMELVLPGKRDTDLHGFTQIRIIN